ncbi:hypothetical protein BUALT_Bualt11G0132200 [Buddleja alternifolia]|uniref:Ubiquitin-like domain-containing protein n=1 Tax=Buddleja alternifolia TaxID=168488 RepID=A0AAV6WTX3_9LAMI|nr:hypothetical protein BUALT_Bualt11G0132200 [Buddleja alternifolia]
MKSLNCSPENCRRKGVIGLGLLPDQKPATITINVSHGLDKYEVAVPSNSTFGYLKSVIAQKIGLEPETHKHLFRDEEKEDDENLQTLDVNDNSELLLVEDATRGEKIPEEIHETFVISKGQEDVAQIRQEVDKLEQQVYALQGVVDSGTAMTVDDKEIIYAYEATA